MRSLIIASFSALAFTATPAAAAQSEKAGKPEQPGKPLTQRNVDAVDVATTPITDLNIRKDEIPQLLIDAQTNPYGLAGLGRCNQLAAKIDEFNAVLGDDVDLPQTPGQRVSPGRVAQSVVGSLIPFRGIVREVSGANDQRRRVQVAIEAGFARRAFLKGVGQERGCKYPARAATREIWEKRLAEIEAAKKDRKDSDSKEDVADAGAK